MLVIIDAMNKLKFSELMYLYREENMKYGSLTYPDCSESYQLIEAEQDFYEYLNSCFFRQNHSCYCIWQTGGSYKAALRLEPFHDGFLICALHTDPDERRKGYGKELISAVVKMLDEKEGVCVYSHVSKKNIASLLLHKTCGFQVIKDYAAYLDGSIDYSSYTLKYR